MAELCDFLVSIRTPNIVQQRINFYHGYVICDAKLRITTIIFNHNFDQDISKVVFPKSLTRLKLGNLFKQDIKKVVFPKNLTHMICNFNNFEQDIVILPSTLTYLKLYISQDIKNIIFPPTLKELHLGYGFNQDISSLAFHPNLVTLSIFGTQFTYPLTTYYLLNIRMWYIDHIQWTDALTRCDINKHNLRYRQLTLFDRLSM